MLFFFTFKTSAQENKETIRKNGYELTFINQDTSFDPALKQRLIATFFEVYPKSAKTYKSKTAKQVMFVIDSAYKGVAATSDDKVDEIREMQIAHSNQPIQHMIYLYNYAGEPWKTQYWPRETMNRKYKPTPDGYCGDEDNGQTSAWNVFSSMGFYPVTPASDQYAKRCNYRPSPTKTAEQEKKAYPILFLL